MLRLDFVCAVDVSHFVPNDCGEHVFVHRPALQRSPQDLTVSRQVDHSTASQCEGLHSTQSGPDIDRDLVRIDDYYLRRALREQSQDAPNGPVVI
jgi:hypothetical protein